MPSKYVVVPTTDKKQAYLMKDDITIAKFYNDDPNNITNAHKVCDLLNETSRSQGKH